MIMASPLEKSNLGERCICTRKVIMDPTFIESMRKDALEVAKENNSMVTQMLAQ